MKIALLAASALALVALPAMAQETTTATPPGAGQTMPNPSTTTMPDTAQDPATQPQGQTMADPAAQPEGQTMSDPAMQQQGQPMTPPAAGQPTNGSMGAPGGQMTQGGYAPSASPMMGTPQPGAQVVFRPSTPVAQAFPAPAAKESYPVCSRTVRDGCRNPGGN